MDPQKFRVELANQLVLEIEAPRYEIDAYRNLTFYNSTGDTILALSGAIWLSILNRLHETKVTAFVPETAKQAARNDSRIVVPKTVFKK